LLLWTTFLLAFSALLPLINPLGSALVFLGLVGDAPPAVFHALARRIAINNIIFLFIIELVGAGILRFFGISPPIIQLAGGMVVVGLGWSVLNQNDAKASSQKKQEECDAREESANRDLEQKAFYPFTFPVTSGPGTLVTMLALTAHSSTHVLSEYVLGHAGILLAVLLLSGLVYVCYAYAPKITRAISPTTAHGILRVVAFITLSIGVQIAWNGLSVLLASVIKR
jgi:multiple antibiotic resistance protein